ncbi:MAG TPA: PPE domain-containing protein [Pseudonocardiaceae bacterium]
MAGPLDVVADLLGLGGPSGNDGGSSNWAAWGHPEICSMLDTSVEPGDIGDAAATWRGQARSTEDVIAGAARDLEQVVSGGWRGASADAALTAVGPIYDWSSAVSATVDHTTQLMDASGEAAGRAKASVPPAQPHDWGESLRSFAVSGVAGAFVDAVVQEQAQSEAHAGAVRIMNNVYSAPINDRRAAVPTYPQLTDPTARPAEPLPSTGPGPVASQPALYPLGGTGAPGGGVAGGHAQHLQPAAGELRRPSYLIEMDDVFTDGQKLAPPVLGADPPERDQ